MFIIITVNVYSVTSYYLWYVKYVVMIGEVDA